MKINGKTLVVLKIIGIAASAAVAVGGWCYGLGQRTHDEALASRVANNEKSIEVLQVRLDERWDRILEEMRRMNSLLEEIRKTTPGLGI